MRRSEFRILALVLLVILLVAIALLPGSEANSMRQRKATETVQLPAPQQKSAVSVEEALAMRRSVREYAPGSLKLAELAQLLWAAQGITDGARGLRTAPSAGALYPLEVYVAAGDVDGLAPGLYKYRPLKHELAKVGSSDVRAALSRAALDQESVRRAPAVIVMTAVHERTSAKYGARAGRYVDMEIGHAAQNVYLQAVSLRLGTVMIGAFYDEEVKKVLNLEVPERPLCLLPVGRVSRAE